MIEYLVESFQIYYGIDYVAMACILLGMYLLTKKNRYGFVCHFFGSIAWLIINVIAGIYAGIVLNLILLVLSVKGFLEWKKE